MVVETSRIRHDFYPWGARKEISQYKITLVYYLVSQNFELLELYEHGIKCLLESFCH